MIVSLYRYIKLLTWLGVYYWNQTDLIEDIIIKNIKECGCVIIKFTQY